ALRILGRSVNRTAREGGEVRLPPRTRRSGREVLRRPLVALASDLLRREELLDREVKLPGGQPEPLADGLHPAPGVGLDVVAELLRELGQLGRRPLLPGGALGGGPLGDRRLRRRGYLGPLRRPGRLPGGCRCRGLPRSAPTSLGRRQGRSGDGGAAP